MIITVRITEDDARARFAAFDLADVLLSLNRECVACYKGELDCDIPLIRDATDKRIFLWAAGETARLAIQWCRAPAFDRRGNFVRRCARDELQGLILVALELLSTNRLIGTVEARRNVERGNFTDSLIRIVEPQYLLQRQSPYRIAQVLLMYQEAAKRRALRDSWFSLQDHNDFLRDALGCHLESFVLAAQQVQGKSCGEHAPLTAENLIPVDKREYDSTDLYVSHGSGLVTTAMGAVLRRLAGTPAEMIAWMEDQYAKGMMSPSHERALLEGPNPLHRFPIVRPLRDKQDHCLAPLPHLITEWLYEPLAAYLYDAADVAAKKRLDAIFEEYVGMLLEICSPDAGSWLHESMLLPEDGSKVVDWVREFDDTVVLVDAKRAFIGIGARYRSMSTDWNTVFEKNWAKAVVQATSFWNAVQNDKVKPLRHCKGKRPLLMVVTLTDADWRAGRPDLATALSPHLPSDKAYIPFTAVSIHRLEQLVSAWEARTVEWLPEVLSDALQRGATDAIGSQTSKSDGKLTKAFGPIFEKLSAQVTSKSAGEGRHAQ